MKIEKIYIGKISFNKLIDAIHELELSEGDTIILHSYNYDDLILGYYDFYQESMKVPFNIFGILIEDDVNGRHNIPKNRIGIVRDDFVDKELLY